MRKRLLSILALTILVTSALVGCSGAPSDSSTLTILSITDGDVFLMKAGADDWTEATIEMTLEVGDTIQTGDDSGAEIIFFDGSTIELEAGTQIEITSLDSSPDGDTKTITLMQTVGTTISRVTKLLDPASTYAIETPSGVAAVRGSVMIVRIVFDDPNYPEGTILMTNVEGHIYWIGHGEELELAEGTQVIATNETTELVQLSLAVDDGVTTDEDTPLTVAAPGVLGNDSGLTVGDTLTMTAVDTSGTVGNVTAWAADGSFAYDPDGQFEHLEAGNTTTDRFTYTVTDEFGITDTATVTITINGVYDEPPYTPPAYIPPAYYPPPYSPPVNHPPVAVDDSATTPQDTPVTIGILDNDSDPDGDALTLDSIGPAGNGTVASNGTGVTYTPNPGFIGTDIFTYTIGDGNGNADTATVTVTVTAVIIQATATISVTVDQGPTAPIYITTDDGWAVDEDTGEPVDGTNHEASGPTHSITVAGGHSYCVYVGGDVTRYVNGPPPGWSGDGTETACGLAEAGGHYALHFTQN
jgi:VCBS repeat-containing protein